MTSTPVSLSAEPVPPAEQSAQIPQPAAPAPAASQSASPGNQRSLVTQEVRFALAFTGGVSLAVWMGGVARELNLLVQASEHRRLGDAVASPYRALLDLVDAEVTIDVLAGTSAGGINSALLGLANARSVDLGLLRDVWLDAGDFGKLMRDPAESSPPSLLKGDGQMLVALRHGIRDLIAQKPLFARRPETDVYITTTLLSPETSRFSDDYGTEITDTDHHGLFHFTRAQLAEPDIADPLALAARSSASFPGAFEPSFVPWGAATTDHEHPDMAPYSNATGPHWAADGGLLVNRPLAPLMQRMFDRSADREVRRALLYVAPTTGGPRPNAPDCQSQPLGLAEALRKDLAAALNQSIAADLAAIKEHNDRVAALADTSRRMAVLGHRLARRTADEPPDDGETPQTEETRTTRTPWISDESVWNDYRRRQAAWIVGPLVDELTRQISTSADHLKLPESWRVRQGADRDAALRVAACRAVVKDWPVGPPADALVAAVALGRPAFDSAKATLIRILNLGRALTTEREQRSFLAERGHAVSRLQSDDGGRAGTPLRDLVRESLATADTSLAPEQWVQTTLAATYWEQFTNPELRVSWEQLRDTFQGCRGWLADLVARTGTVADRNEEFSVARPSADRRRTVAAETLADYLSYFDRWPDDVIASFVDLHVVTRSVLPVLKEVAQPVELIQVSADTRTQLAPGRDSAGDKLTGLQMHHFGAFYKPSWRANDWMWGRLDGCGWLVHILLDPRRILAVLENDNVPPAERVAKLLARLESAFGPGSIDPDDLDDLSFLESDSRPVPVNLPKLALQVAAVLQHPIAAEELRVVAAQARARSTYAGGSPASLQERVTGIGQQIRQLSDDLTAVAPAPGARRWRERLRQWRHLRLARRQLGQLAALANITPADFGFQGAPSDSVSRWLDQIEAADLSSADAVGKLLLTCPVGRERILEEAKEPTPLFVRTATQAAAVATAAGTAIGPTPTSLKPTFATARTITRTAYTVANRARGRRRRMALFGLVMLAVATAGLFTSVPFVGLPAIVLFGAGAIVLAFGVGQRMFDALRILLALAVLLLAVSPWLKWLWPHVHTALRNGVEVINDHKWSWPVLLLLVLLPPASSAVNVWRRFRARRPAQAQPAAVADLSGRVAWPLRRADPASHG